MTVYKILFELRHSDGTLIDKCSNQPFEFELGDGQLDLCLEKCVLAAKLGRDETFLLTADQAFGAYDPQAVQKMDKSNFDVDTKFVINQVIEFRLPNGKKTAGYIRAIDDNHLSVDFNHLLAGQDVIFKVKVLASD